MTNIATSVAGTYDITKGAGYKCTEVTVKFRRSFHVLRQKMREMGVYGISETRVYTDHAIDEETLREQVRKLYIALSLSVERQRIMSIFSVLPAQIGLSRKIPEWAAFSANDMTYLVRRGWLRRLLNGDYLIHQAIKDSIQLQMEKGDLEPPAFSECESLCRGYVQLDLENEKNMMDRNQEQLTVLSGFLSRYDDSISDDELHVDILNDIALCYHRQGDYQRSIAFLQQALTVIENSPSINRAEYVAACHNISITHNYLKNPVESYKFAKFAWDEAKRVFRENDPQTICFELGIGNSLMNMERFAEAKQHYLHAYKISEAIKKTAPEVGAKVLNRLARYYGIATK